MERKLSTYNFVGLPRWLSHKQSTYSAGNMGSIPGWEDPLEKGMANHSSILAWEIPWTEEPSRLYRPWDCKRVGHDLAAKQWHSSTLTKKKKKKKSGLGWLILALWAFQWLSGKEPTCSAGDPGLIFESGRSPIGGHNNVLQYSCLENPVDREAWWVIVHSVA